MHARVWMLGVVLGLSPMLAQAATERYTVMIGGTDVGHLVAEHDGDTVSIDYDFKNNGRGPTIAETIELGADGLPLRWTVTGSTTFGSAVDELFERDGDTLRWRDALGDGEATANGTQVYVAQGASPWALGMYARALREASGQSLPALPGGTVRLEAGEDFRVGEGDAAITVRTHAVSGLSLSPTWFVLDEDDALFAVISPRFNLIRSGYEAEDERLGELAARLGRERLTQIHAEVAHRFDAPIRIHDVRVFDPGSMRVGEPVDVVVWGNRIAGVQPAGGPRSEGEVLVDGQGGTLVPGLYEMHGHIGQEGAMLNLAAGVTTIRDMGNDVEVLEGLIASIDNGSVGGPRIHRSGFIEGRSPFSSNNGRLVSSQDEALDAVRWYAARGFHQVKLYNSMNPAWSAAAAAEAHRLGLRVSGHVPAFSNADAMIEAGYDELTHINQIMLGWVLEPDEDTRTLLRLTALQRLANLDLDSAPVRRTMDHIVERGVAVEPTIAIHENLLLNQDGEVPRGAAHYIGHMPVGVQRSLQQAWTDMSAPGAREDYAIAFEKVMDTLREMHARGVLLIPGTDLGGSFAFHRELMLFEQLGMSPAQVLRRATLDMARYLGEEQALGTIARGKLADFFLVPGDPTDDLSALSQIRLVVKDGVVYLPAEIHARFGIRPFVEPVELVVPDAAAVAAGR